jgi:hypothetical protein
VHHHAFITLHVFGKSKIIWYKTYFILLIWFCKENPLLLFLYWGKNKIKELQTFEIVLR